MMQRRGRFVFRFVVALAMAQFVLAAIVLGVHGAPGALGGDFIAYYSAGKLALAGRWQHLYELAAQLTYQRPLVRASGLPAGGPSMIPFDYPPPAALFFLPLAALPARAATMLWLAINTAAALVSWRVMFRQDGAGVGAAPTGTIFALFLLFPLDWGLLSGQPVGLILLLAALSFRSLLRRQDTRAGIWLGALVIFKPQLLVVPLLGLLVLRRPRAVLGTALTGAVLLATSLILVGFQGLFAYLQLLRQIDPALGNAALAVRASAMINWRAWIAAIPGIDSNAALALTAAAAVVTVAAALIPCIRLRGDTDFAPNYLGLTAAGLLAGYHSHYQDLVMLLPPAMMVLAGWTPPLGRGHPPVHGRVASHHSLRPQWITEPAMAALLLVVGPGIAWLIFGIFALSWLHVWTYLAVPGLLLVLVAVWRRGGVISGNSTQDGYVVRAAATLGNSATPAMLPEIVAANQERLFGA